MSSIRTFFNNYQRLEVNTPKVRFKIIPVNHNFEYRYFSTGINSRGTLIRFYELKLTVSRDHFLQFEDFQKYIAKHHINLEVLERDILITREYSKLLNI